MATTRKNEHAGRSIVLPMGLIVALIFAYWVLADWNIIPSLIAETVRAFS
jgi:hypothetical protein